MPEKPFNPKQKRQCQGLCSQKYHEAAQEQIWGDLDSPCIFTPSREGV